MRTTSKAISLLWLTPLLGISCGDPTRSSGVDVAPPSVESTVASAVASVVETGRADHFLALALVTLIETSRWCSTLKVGGVIVNTMCTESDHFPVMAWGESTRDLMLLIVDTGETISFAEGNARMLDSTAHWVAAQLTSEMSYGDVRFTVSSERGVRSCALTNQLFMHCTR